RPWRRQGTRTPAFPFQRTPSPRPGLEGQAPSRSAQQCCHTPLFPGGVGWPSLPFPGGRRCRFLHSSPFFVYSSFLRISIPFDKRILSRWNSFRSDSTISRTMSCTVLLGCQPSLVLALVGSPISKSTSVGRK